MASNSRARGRLGGLAATALVVSGLVAATPATASDSPSSDALAWGFKESFRRYVAGPMNSEPVGSRIVPQTPASFDGEGDETRPYLFPVASAAFTDVDNVAIGTAGGVTYNFPSHFFTITVSDVEVEVVAGELVGVEGADQHTAGYVSLAVIGDPVVEVVDLAAIPWCVAARPGTPTILGVQHDSLIG